MVNPEFHNIKEIIEKSNNIAVMPSKVAGVDAFSAGVGLYYMLKDKGKKPTLLYQGKRPEECKDIVKDEEVLSAISQRELLVTVDYSGTSATQMHHKSENDILYITVGPISKNYDLTRVKTEIKGTNYDLFFTVGAQDLIDYGQFYDEMTAELKTGFIINLDITDMNKRFGNVNIVDSTESSLSVLTLAKGVEWGLKPSITSSKAFLTGILSRKLGI